MPYFSVSELRAVKMTRIVVAEDVRVVEQSTRVTSARQNFGTKLRTRGVRKCLFKRLFAFKIGKIDLNIKRLNGILFKTVRLLCLKGPECLTRLESLKQNRFKQIMHHDV